MSSSEAADGDYGGRQHKSLSFENSEYAENKPGGGGFSKASPYRSMLS